MIVGSLLSYYVGIKLMEKTNQLDGYLDDLSDDVKQLTQNVNLNYYEKTIANLIVVQTNKKHFTDIIGHDRIKKDLYNLIIKPIQNPNFYKNCKLLQPPSGVLLHGPPGTGKTMLAQALSCELNCTFINFDLGLIENKLYGESLKILKALFTLAAKLKPTIIFIDEIDGVFATRSSLDQSHVTSIKTSILQELDGFVQKDPNIIVIAATNRKFDLDPALIRRLPIQLFVSKPSTKELKLLFDYYLNDFHIPNTLDIASKCSGLTGSNVHDICKLAAHRAASSNKNKFTITPTHLYEAIQDLHPSFEIL